MDNLVDTIKMEVFSASKTKKEKDRWKYLILFAILSNYRHFFSELRSAFALMFTKFGILKKSITPPPKPEVPPSAIVKLQFGKGGDINNKIFKELLNKHAIQFDVVQLKNPHNWHVINPKTIQIADDIFFRLEFNEKPLPAKKEKKKKKDGEEDDVDDEEEQKKLIAIQQKNLEYELGESRGKVFSYSLNLEELLKFLHTNYIPVEPKATIVKDVIPKEIVLHRMIVGRATKFDYKSNEMFGEKLEFTISKNLDNIFLEPEMRDRLMSQIERFNDPAWYAERGLPRTLGICMHGEPGCGKTSFIKSLCAYTKRRAVIVDFKLVKTVSHLRKIFSGYMFDEHSNQLSFPRDSTVYVFEDFDCMSKVFMDRKLKDAEESNKKDEPASLIEELLVIKKLEEMEKEKVETAKRNKRMKKKRAAARKKKAEIAKKNGKSVEEESSSSESEKENETIQMFGGDDEDGSTFGGYGGYGGYGSSAKWGSSFRAKEEVTLADFLELLDGIVEMDGRIIIMTTNQREKMDSALVRPGRIDLDLELSPPSVLLIGHVFKHMYKQVEDDTLKELFLKYFDQLPNKVVSTAQVINSFMFPNPEMGLQAVIQRAKDADVIMDTFLLEHQEKQIYTAKSIWDKIIESENEKISRKSDRNSSDLWNFFREIPFAVSMSSERNSSARRCIMDANQASYCFESSQNATEEQWVLFDFGDYPVNITEYAVKNLHTRWRLYNWTLEGSDDNYQWTSLSVHVNDRSIIEIGTDVAKYKIPNNENFYQYIRLRTQESFYNDSCSTRNGASEVQCCFALRYIQFFGTAKTTEVE